jgi:hypothetical protein
MEVDEIISYHDVVVKENFGARFNDLIRRRTNPPWRTFQRITRDSPC